jgi:hypothetical protein
MSERKGFYISEVVGIWPHTPKPAARLVLTTEEAKRVAEAAAAAGLTIEEFARVMDINLDTLITDLRNCID